MAKKCGTWRKIEDRHDAIIWKNTKKPRITAEAHKFDTPDDEYLDGKWYVFPAKNGTGIPSSPEIVETKNDAKKEISELKEEYC